MTLFERLQTPLVIVGPPGSGKTAVGQALSQKLSIPFYDLDSLIESSVRVSIDQIFKHRSESYFRLIESQTLQQFVKRPRPARFIFATGGGTVMTVENRNEIKKLGRSIYLKTSWETLEERWKQKEPLMVSRHELCDFKIILKEREKYYMESDSVVVTDKRSVRQVVQDILKGENNGKRG